MPDHLKFIGIFVISLLALVQGVSTKKDVDEAMREGEAAFAKGDFPKALEHYQRALLLDPKLYQAAVMIGDIYFKSAEQDKASEWFARAIQIKKTRESHRTIAVDDIEAIAAFEQRGDGIHLVHR